MLDNIYFNMNQQNQQNNISKDRLTYYDFTHLTLFSHTLPQLSHTLSSSETIFVT